MQKIKKKTKPKPKPVPMEVEESEPEDTPSNEPQPEEKDPEDPNASDDDDEMDLANFKVSSSSSAPTKKRKKGIIYISNIPKHMNVTRLREILGEYGTIGRVYLQPEKLSSAKAKKNKRKHYNIHFTEGWVEFESKRVAKQIVPLLNNKQISTRKKSQFFDSLWSMKYLPRFKWVHLTERMNYEQAVHKQRLHTEVSQARKETTFFQNNLDKSEFLKKQAKKAKKAERSQAAKAETEA
ncbi:pre-rRNA-processing protein esf2-like [Drosophila ficusphila]|uniref:pre-rRNA-processing protein esf2-like n=1 Tax=Drosophila ficusphila TaxID=30025 RepID=UPI0007E853CC|nr:pre-rRNA-processing protein esf2-like [Drosophila ficusphila]